MFPSTDKARRHFAGLATVVLVIAFTAVLTGCLYLNHRHIDASFRGMNSALEETQRSGGTFRVLAVHGMGNHEPRYSEVLFAGLARRMHVQKVPSSEQTNPIVNAGLLYSFLRTVDYASGTRKMRLYEVTWSPLTYLIKRRQFKVDQSFGPPKRQLVNGALKAGLLDDSLSDAVLYTGQYRTNMQFPIAFTIQQILEDHLRPEDRVAMVSYSLGSYMTFDTLRAIRNGQAALHGLRVQPQDVVLLAKQTTIIYMLANQLPLLELTEISQPVSTNESPAGQKSELLHSVPAPRQVPSPLRNFLELRASVQEVTAPKLPPAALRHLQIVAFSDPNDLLSFPLEPRNYTNVPDTDVSAANVDLVIAHWSYLGVVSNPQRAHTGWNAASAALDLMAFGGGRSAETPSAP